MRALAAAAQDQPQDATVGNPSPTDVPGVVYSVTHAEAVANGWPLDGIRPLGRKGVFVECETSHRGTHKYLAIQSLGGPFIQNSITEQHQSQESGTETGDTADSEAQKLIFPNLDAVLAKTLSTPFQFVSTVVESEWFTNASAIGPVADTVQAILNDTGVKEKMEDLTAQQIAVQKFDALLTLAQFRDGRKGNISWLGSPRFPEQFFRAVQLRVAAMSSPVWRCPPEEFIIGIVRETADIWALARATTKKISSTGQMEWSEVDSLMRRARQLKANVELDVVDGGRTWKEVCNSAGGGNLDDIMTMILEQRREREMHRALWAGTPDTPGRDSDRALGLPRERLSCVMSQRTVNRNSPKER